MNKTALVGLYLGLTISLPSHAELDKYLIDTRGTHAYIQFKVSHFGFSYVLGQFREFKGAFCHDPTEPEASYVSLQVNVASLSTGHAERDKHIRGEDYLDADQYPVATFESTGYQSKDDGTALLTGDFTLRGATKPTRIVITPLGIGDDPWGRYRAGFEGSLKVVAADFGMEYFLGEAAKEIDIYISLEGIRSKYADIECPTS